MYKLRYDRLNIVIINSYLPAYIHIFRYDFNIGLIDYIKSQIHYDITTKTNSRDYLVYVRALKFLRGDKKYREQFYKVLKYFYEDFYKVATNLKAHFVEGESLAFQISTMPSIEEGMSEVEIREVETLKNELATLPLVDLDYEHLQTESQRLNALISTLRDCVTNPNPVRLEAHRTY
ncbi:MAG: hypothetical protein E7H54_04895 [Clostridium perfringens]|nr:hypothetical protein [Clostridium perfringens]